MVSQAEDNLTSRKKHLGTSSGPWHCGDDYTMKLDKSTSICPGILTTEWGGTTVRLSTVTPVKLEIGSKSYCTDVYVAPIDDDMLLGLDFLKRHQTITPCYKQLGCEAWKLCQFSGWWMFCQFRQQLTHCLFLPDLRHLHQTQRFGMDCRDWIWKIRQE
jgi:hypothetical protein